MARMEALHATGGMTDITTETQLVHTVQDKSGRWISTNVSSWSSLVAALTNIRPGDRVHSMSRRAASTPEYLRLSARGGSEGLWAGDMGARLVEEEVEDDGPEVQAEGVVKYSAKLAKPPVYKRVFAGLIL